MSNVDIKLSRLCGILEGESKKLREIASNENKPEKEELLTALNIIESTLSKLGALRDDDLAFKPQHISLQTDLSNLRTVIQKEHLYGQEYLKRQVQYLADKLDALIVRIKPAGFLPRLNEFIIKHPHLSENWAVAMCYLGAMEIMLNRFLTKFNVDLEELKVQKHGMYDYTFADKYFGFVRYLRYNGIPIPKLESELPKIFYSIRNKVVHEGFSPDDKDLEFIMEYCERVVNLIEEAERKLEER